MKGTEGEVFVMTVDKLKGSFGYIRTDKNP